MSSQFAASGPNATFMGCGPVSFPNVSMKKPLAVYLAVTVTGVYILAN
jgi:hypothetical protein